jgi:hypothetical protein
MSEDLNHILIEFFYGRKKTCLNLIIEHLTQILARIFYTEERKLAGLQEFNFTRIYLEKITGRKMKILYSTRNDKKNFFLLSVSSFKKLLFRFRDCLSLDRKPFVTGLNEEVWLTLVKCKILRKYPCFLYLVMSNFTVEELMQK